MEWFEREMYFSQENKYIKVDRVKQVCFLSSNIAMIVEEHAIQQNLMTNRSGGCFLTFHNLC